MGGLHGGYIDFKKPFSDDFDARLMCDGTWINLQTAQKGQGILLNVEGLTGYGKEAMRVTDLGWVGIGGLNPEYKVDMFGDTRVMNWGCLPIKSGLVGWYDRWSFNTTTKVWTDKSGNGNHTIAARSGTISVDAPNEQFIYGGTDAGLTFPAAILPATYTLFHVTKYNGASKARIIQSVNQDALHGHWNTQAGVAYVAGTWVNNSALPDNTVWVLSIGTKSLYRSQLTNRSTTTSVTFQLGLNTGAAEYSDWACAEIIVYNRELTNLEIRQVEGYLNNKYSNLNATWAAADYFKRPALSVAYGDFSIPYGRCIKAEGGLQEFAWSNGTTKLIEPTWESGAGDIVNFYTPGSATATPKMTLVQDGTMRVNGGITTSNAITEAGQLLSTKYALSNGQSNWNWASNNAGYGVWASNNISTGAWASNNTSNITTANGDWASNNFTNYMPKIGGTFAGPVKCCNVATPDTSYIWFGESNESLRPFLQFGVNQQYGAQSNGTTFQRAAAHYWYSGGVYSPAAGCNTSNAAQNPSAYTMMGLTSNGLSVTSNITFGSTTRQMLNLYSTTYGLGVQASTLYSRTVAGFAWYKGGTHNDAQWNNGSGTTMMTLNENSALQVTGNVYGSNAFIGDVGHGASWAGFSHTSSISTGGYGLLQSISGQTLVNCAAGQNIEFRVNNTTKAKIQNSGKLTCRSSVILSSSDTDTYGWALGCLTDSNIALGYSSNTSTVEGNSWTASFWFNKNGEMTVVNGAARFQGATSATFTYGWLNSAGSTGSATGTNNYSILATNRCQASEFNSTSDARVKDEINKFEDKLCAKLVADLEQKHFKFLPDNRYKIGFIAQEVEEVVPNAVSVCPHDDIPDFKVLDTNQLVAVLWGAVRDLQQEVRKLKGEKEPTKKSKRPLPAEKFSKVSTRKPDSSV